MRVAALALAALLAWPIATFLIERAARSRFAGPPASVSILPFDIGTGAQIQAGLIDFLAARMQSNPLVRSAWLVFSPGDARQMGVTTPAKAAAVFGATHALTGSITGDGTSLTVEGRLVDTASGRVSGTFKKSCPLDDQICLQDGLLLAIGRVLDPKGFEPQASPRISKEALPYYLRGMEYLRRDSLSYDMAIEQFRRALTIDPPAIMPRIGLAEASVFRYRAAADAKALPEAEAVLEAALPENPDLPDLHAVLGQVRGLQGRYDDATRELLKAVQADPSNHVFHLRLGDVYAAASQDAEAQAEYERVLALQPRDWRGHLNFALLHYNRGRFDEAARLMEQLIQWTPDHAQVLANLGTVYIAAGRNGEAETVSRRACSLRPDRSCHLNLGIALQRQRRSEEAIAEYERALTFGTPNVTLFLNLATAHTYLGQLDQARGYFQRAIASAEERLRVNVQDSAQRAILSYCLAHMGDSPRARFEIEQALQHSPDDRAVQRYAVLTFERLGQRERVLDIVKGVSRPVLNELEASFGTEQLQSDPRYQAIAAEVRSR